MKKIIFPIVILTILIACKNSNEPETHITTNESLGSRFSTYDGDNLLHELIVDNPIDSCPVINEKMSGSNSDMVQAADMLAKAWKDEMINAYQCVYELSAPDDKALLSEAQIGFQTYVENAVPYFETILSTKNGYGTISPLATISYNKSLYRMRTIELIDCYNQLSDTPYKFSYTGQVD